MHPVLFHIGSYPVRAYGLAIVIAVFGSSAFAVWLGRRRQLPWAELYDSFAVWALLGGILGARIWEVVFNWSYYRTVPHEIYAIWEGGLSIQGGVIGGLTAAWIYTRVHKVSLGRFLDGLTPALLLGQAIGRLFGCTLNGDAYGKPTGTSFGIVHAPGTNAHMVHGAQPLWPAEVFEGIFDLALMGVMIRLGVNNRGPAGHLFLLYAVLYSAGRFALEFLRGDTPHILAGLTAAQIGSIGVIAMATLLLVWQTLALRGRAATGPVEPS